MSFENLRKIFGFFARGWCARACFPEGSGEGGGMGAVYYQCQRCTNCCKWPGFVKLTEEDITAIAAFLGRSESDFIQSHTRLRQHRDGLALIDKPNGECIFLEGRDCRVQPVKPRQCRGFPNTWNFPGWREVCEAIEVRSD